MPPDVTDWTLTNDRGLELLGTTHTPEGEPVACVLLLHGFLGYKDYGFLPVLSDRLCVQGVQVHRFNFSCSGMTNATDTFERPELFEQDTWNRQVEDVRRVARSVREGELPGAGLPLWLVGHSRGGDTAILSAGRHASELGLSGLVTINAPADCCRLSEGERRDLLERGHKEVTSGRTGQTLCVGRAWLEEQLAEPAEHDLEIQIARAACPVVVMQGDADDTVSLDDGNRLARAANTDLVVLEGGTHVLNVPNPAGPGDPGPVLGHAAREILGRVTQCL
ncbi:MAG: alpha/beta hydrolase [Phycisphaerales bacterium JB040]